MATALGRLQLSVYDNNGNTGSVLSHVSFDDGQTAAQMVTEIGAYATAFGNVSDAGIKAGSFDVVSLAVARNPGGDANLPSGGNYFFQPAAPGGVFAQHVPSILDSVRGPSGTLIIASGAGQAWCNLLVNSGAGPYSFTDEAFYILQTALRGFRSDRRGKRRRK